MHQKIKSHVVHHAKKIAGLGELWGIKVVLLALVFSAGVYSGRYVFPLDIASAQSVPDSINYSMGTIKIEVPKEMKLYEDVKKILEDKFIDAKNITEQTKAYGSIDGLIKAYGDPYTTFFAPQQAKDFKAAVSGTFSGVGIITVVAPLKKSPAEKAGMKPDDKILKINGTSTEGMTTETAVSLIRGEKGTPVTLSISRLEGEKKELKLKDITIIRDKIDLPVIETQTVRNTFIISLYSFTETSPQKFQEALVEFEKSKKKNLVIDLRNNPGGYLEAAVLMGSFFFDSSKNIVSENFVRTGAKNTHMSKGFNAIPADVKVVILVNGGSASASEILAGAFQDYSRAKIVGEKTFGKGSVQEYIELPTGESLKVTVAHWLTPGGQNISKDGIHPDVVVPFKEDKSLKPKTLTDRTRLDNQLEAAVKVLENWKKYENASARNKTEVDLDGKLVATASSTATGTLLKVEVK
jgi:carboxyl-terminal processing protease